jgi:chromate transporter
VLAILAAAVIRIGRRALKNEVMWLLAALAFVAIYFFHAPFPLIVFAAALIGLIGGKIRPGEFLSFPSHSSPDAASTTSVLDDASESPVHTRPSLAHAAKVCAVSLLLWWTPVIALGAWLGWHHALFREGLFFSKAAMVTFGGAYAVLPYVGQQAVENHQWLSAAQMLDGLGLAETTPGPLIMVLQFVGFLGGWHQPGTLAPLAAASLGAFITTWTTFVPCFLWIFLGAPHIEQLRGNRHLTAALSAVTAAIVGVILNLAVWFGLHLILPAGKPADWYAAAVSAGVFTGMVKWKWDIIPVVLGAGLLGLLCRAVL